MTRLRRHGTAAPAQLPGRPCLSTRWPPRSAARPDKRTSGSRARWGHGCNAGHHRSAFGRRGRTTCRIDAPEDPV